MNPYHVRATIFVGGRPKGIVIGITDHWLRKSAVSASGAKIYCQASPEICAIGLRLVVERMEEDDIEVPNDPRAERRGSGSGPNSSAPLALSRPLARPRARHARNSPSVCRAN